MQWMVPLVYIAVEGFEESLGFDPNDPIVPFVLLVGTSATLWVFFWVVTYSGYAGDLSPQLTLEILTETENAILREKDRISDDLRAARFCYASVNLLEVYGSQRKLFKNGRDLENTLTAAVIQNLKIVHDRSKVIVLDADGSHSKGIARSLRKLGVKASQPYLVQGGFQSWVKQGLHIKELKLESTLTEAEAILEDIKPSPVQALGYGVQLFATGVFLNTGAFDCPMGAEKSISANLVNEHSCQNGPDYIVCKYYVQWNSSSGDLYKNSSIGGFELKYIENSDLSATENGVVFIDQLNESENVLSGSAEPEAITAIDITSESSTSVAPSVSLDVKGFDANDVVDVAIGKLFSTFDQIGELAGNKLMNFSSGLKESTGEAGVAAVDVLRRTIVGVEDALTNGISFLLYSYQAPPEISSS
ncbi:Rhodanese-like domain containing protein [Parasponia andersonii]|uniref:Rhodanese-like domain containing protein n=1 Tax=Parasponia andersonii TaxID=3476 RepID=A0A2P5BD24_PARAD|nr:Rhodanese-like domain containing protein [Parasponia andersonii]